MCLQMKIVRPVIGTFDGTASIDSAFSNIDFDDFGSLGGLI